MSSTTIIVLVGASLAALLGLVIVIAIIVAVFANRGPTSLSRRRWRALQRDADAKIAQQQLADDYQTLVRQGGYEID